MDKLLKNLTLEDFDSARAHDTFEAAIGILQSLHDWLAEAEKKYDGPDENKAVYTWQLKKHYQQMITVLITLRDEHTSFDILMRSLDNLN